MINNYSFLYNFDLIGPTPQLFIFDKDKYKSPFSFFLSLHIIFFSIFFIIYSLIQYFKFNNPIVNYSKSADQITKRKIFIKDTFLMFQLIDSSKGEPINDSIAHFEGDFRSIYDKGYFDSGPLFIEKCEYGKNKNLKYKELIELKANFGRPIEEFFCFRSQNENVSLFYNPKIGYNSINVNIILKNNSYYIPEKIQVLIISENNIIDHHNKEKPISEGFIYLMTSTFNSKEFTTINYGNQYIKYESDDGYIFNNNKFFQGISFLDMDFNRKIKNTYNLEKDLKELNKSHIGSISFEINKSNFDNYKRTYPRLLKLCLRLIYYLK